MFRKGRRGGKRVGLKKRAQRARVVRPVRRARTVAERASLSETKPFQLLNPNQIYTNYSIQLSSFPRASLVAKGYQLYRIKSVQWKISPLADTFANAGSSVPYLYYMVDRTKNLSMANTVVPLKRMGAKPRRLDDKIVSFSLRPSVLTGTLDTQPPAGQSTTQFTQYKISPWLNTRDSETIGVWNPDSTDHGGLVFIVENSGGAPVLYKCEMVVEFEFCKPSFEVIPSETAPAPLELIEQPEPIVL